MSTNILSTVSLLELLAVLKIAMIDRLSSSVISRKAQACCHPISSTASSLIDHALLIKKYEILSCVQK